MGKNEVFAISLRLRDKARDTGAMMVDWGLVPSRSWLAGECRSRPNGAPLEGNWPDSYATARLVLPDDRSLAETLDNALRETNAFSAQLAQFVETGGRAELFVGWHIMDNSGATIDPKLMRRLSERGLALALDIYPEGSTDEGNEDA